MIALETERLLLRNWIDSDRDLFREIFSDPKVMEFFPYRRSYAEADEIMDRVRGMIEEDGIGFLAATLRETGEPIGFCGLSHTHLEPALPDNAVEIGWRLATRFWGNGYASEAARALLALGFETHGFDEILSFAVIANQRSLAVMERIGMQRDPSGDFDHPRVPDSHPHLKRHALYRMTKAAYRESRHQQAIG